MKKSIQLKISITTMFLILIFLIINCSSNNPVEKTLPRMLADTTSVSVTAPRGGMSPLPFFVNVNTDTNEHIVFSFSNNTVWIELQNASGISRGTTPDSFLVTFRISAPYTLGVGIYYDTITISSEDASNSPLKKEISVTIGSELAVSPSILDFHGASGGNNPSRQNVIIKSTTVVDFPYTISTESSWLILPITNGITSSVDSIPINVDISGLIEGVYSDSIMISSDDFLNSPIYLKCHLSISPWLSQESPLGGNLFDVFFIDELNGWAVGFIGDAHSRSGTIINTTDGGINWNINLFDNEHSFGRDSSLFGAIQFIGDTGWVIGEKGMILKTIDNGQTWNTTASGLADTLLNLNNLHFISSRVGWIVGDSGTIIKTVDAGETWIVSNRITSLGLNSVIFMDELNGWAAGILDIILRTSDGGITWTQQDVPPSQVINNSYDFNDIYFTDINHGWAVGKLGYVVSTINGGITWEPTQLTNPSKLNSVYFIDSQTGWIAGQNGSILRTTDGGISWHEQFSNTENWIFSLYFLNSSLGWAVGEYGTILITSSGGVK